AQRASAAFRPASARSRAVVPCQRRRAKAAAAASFFRRRVAMGGTLVHALALRKLTQAVGSRRLDACMRMHAPPGHGGPAGHSQGEHRMQRFLAPLALLGLLALSACGPRVFYRWSSLQGRHSFGSSQNITNTAWASCNGSSLALNLICSGACTRQGRDCAASCPDLVAETH